jgi:hypothetical protein
MDALWTGEALEPVLAEIARVDALCRLEGRG